MNRLKTMENLRKSWIVVCVVLVLATSNVAAVVPQNGYTVDENITGLDYSSDGFSSFFKFYEKNDQLKVNISGVTDPGQYQGDVEYVNESNSSKVVTEKYTIGVDGFNNYTVKPSGIDETISVGDSGELRPVYLTAEGNQNRILDVNVTGNASNFLDVRPSITSIPGTNRTVLVAYTTSRSTDKGFYTADLNVGGEKVNISLDLVDRIFPVFESVRIEDMMATTSQEFNVDVGDNLGVAGVELDVWRRVQVVSNNSTVIKNETVLRDKEVVFEGGSSTGEGSYTFSFNKSDVITDYYVNVTLTDTSNNSVSRLEKFTVNGLNSIEVLRSDFRFDDMRPRTDENPERQVEEPIIKKSLQKPLILELSSFTHRKSNSSIAVGIRAEDSENIQYLYKNGQKNSVNVTGSGRFFLVVYSDSKGDTYDGTVKLMPPSQHVPIDTSIEFSGTVVDPEYPPLPESRSLGSFNGSLEFILSENDVPIGIRFTGEQYQISDCKGTDSWSNCIPGFTLGEIPETRDKIQSIKNQLFYYQIGTAAALIVAAWSALIALRGRDLLVFKGVPQNQFDKTWESMKEFERWKNG